MTGQMRLEQRMKLAPRMIQSMEILQLPTLALLEKIEAELNSNPVLETEESAEVETAENTTAEEVNEINSDEKDSIASTEEDKSDGFEKINDFPEQSDDYLYRTEFSKKANYNEPDKKLEAMNNTADNRQSLHDYISEQWLFVDADEKVKTAGQLIIDYIDKKGYLQVRLQQLHNKDKHDFSIDHLLQALKLVHQLEPVGVGARDLKECLLIQFSQSPDNMSFETELVSKYLDKLLENKLPEIARRMNCSVEQIGEAIKRMRKFDTSPGLQIGNERNHPIKADVIVDVTEDGSFAVYLADRSVPSLRINQYYSDMSRDRKLDSKTRDFLKGNIRSARWLMDAIEQRKDTLLKVSRAIVEQQHEFFLKGITQLRPLPMSEIANIVGIHVATVSRAVAGKYILSSQGIMPLRDLFGVISASRC